VSSAINISSPLTANVVNTLARSYNVLGYSNNLRAILSSVLPKEDFSSLSKVELHRMINHILTKAYKGESALKAKLVEMFVEKDVTAAFEIRVNNSRVDFLTVNGDTISYEIKSGIDNLNKLSKQINDYEKVFEFNYLVIDEKHLESVKELIPAHYGIYISHKDKLVKNKGADRNSCLESKMQLKLFTQKELGQHFECGKLGIEEVAKQFSATQINEGFKSMLKKRYERKWLFLKQNMNEVLPIDYQYFFHHNIAPKIIYGA
jgi:hypothetical protein